MIKRLLALCLCLSLLSASAAAVRAPAYTVSNGLTYVSDPDVLALFHFDGDLSDASSHGSSAAYSGSNYRTSFNTTHTGFGTFTHFTTTSYASGGLPRLWFTVPGLSDLDSFCIEFFMFGAVRSSSGRTILRMANSYSTSFSSFDVLHFGNNKVATFCNANNCISADALSDSLPSSSSNAIAVKLIFADGAFHLFLDGTYIGSESFSSQILDGFGFFLVDAAGFGIDELRVTTGAYTDSLDSYIPPVTAFTISDTLDLPSDPVTDCIYLQSSVVPSILFLGGDLPESPAVGDTHVSLNAENVAQSIQLYDGSAWQDVAARIYSNSGWYDVIGYSFTLSATEKVESVRPLLSTPFADYTVTEGLLLALLLCVVAASIFKLIKEGFYWLW